LKDNINLNRSNSQLKNNNNLEDSLDEFNKEMNKKINNAKELNELKKSFHNSS